MSEVERLRDDLDAALAVLTEVFAGISQISFEQSRESRSIRDLIWHTGLQIDWTRRAVDQGISGRPVDAFLDRARPAIAQTAEYMAMWLEQCHRPMLALLRRLSDDALDQNFTLAAGETTSPRALLEALVDRLRNDAEQVRTWRPSERASEEK